VVTGDELVEVDGAPPAPHQVRRSNDHALRANLLGAGFTRVERFHLRDLKHELEQQLKRLIAEFDVILLTGGISKGKLDLLPLVLEELGVQKKFQGVSQRPGKPFWFGLTTRQTPVFALPGNPVSTFICFQRYVLPALGKMSGGQPGSVEWVQLAADARTAFGLMLFLPVRLDHSPDGRRLAKPVAFNTSGDFVSLIGTDGFVEIGSTTSHLVAGTAVPFRPWR
jgi:molybdopterin molybdotransferase